VIFEIIQKRKLCSEKELAEKGDFLSIILTDELFKNDEKSIIDECLTFFFAGSQTSAITTQNLIMYLMQQPDTMKRVRDEISE
jgi:cytochrome P450